MNHTTIDPVCGMTVHPEHAAGSSEYGNETYHFCAASCKSAFDAAPENYVTRPAAATASCCGGGHCATT